MTIIAVGTGPSVTHDAREDHRRGNVGRDRTRRRSDQGSPDGNRPPLYALPHPFAYRIQCLVSCRAQQATNAWANNTTPFSTPAHMLRFRR